MKKQILIIGVFALSLALFAQEISHEALVINIEVSVRVFKGNKFVDNLTIKDFEVFEDGIPQKIEAVYLVKKTSIKKEEGEKKYAPEVSRNFVLLFEIQEYLPKIGEAIDYFFDTVILPGDNIIVITPLKTYNFKSRAFKILPKKEIVNQLKGKLKRDAKMGSAEYRNLIKEIEDLLAGRDIPPEVWESRLSTAADMLRRLENLRYVDEKKLLGFAEFLKNKEGQKYVFLFYQKELIPQYDLKYIQEIESNSQDRPDILFQLSDLFNFYRRDISFDVDLVKKVFSDSSISIHFMFITKTPHHELDITRIGSMSTIAMRMQGQSEDIFSAFNEVARATGGLSESSANAASAFKRAVDASENYYLLYYSPLNYREDGKFKEIKVRVKNKSYKVIHRFGYLAD